MTRAMTGKQYEAAIARLGFNQMAAGRWLGVAPRTAQNYVVKGPPEPIARLLRMMLRLRIDPDELR